MTNDSTRDFLTRLGKALRDGEEIDECLHCTMAGNGPLAARAGIDVTTFDRKMHETVLAELKATATDEARRKATQEAHGFNLYWMFNDVYLLCRHEHPDLEQALRRMACRVEWGELWRSKGRCPEPPLKPVDQARVFLAARLPAKPEWRDSVLYLMIAL